MTPAASFDFSSAAPLFAGAVASDHVMEGTGITAGTAVLIILGGGAFLLSIVVNVMKLRSYSRTDRKTEAKAEAADLASKEELKEAKRELREAQREFRQEITSALQGLTKEFHAAHADMKSHIGKLAGMAAAHHPNTSPN